MNQTILAQGETLGMDLGCTGLGLTVWLFDNRDGEKGSWSAEKKSEIVINLKQGRRSIDEIHGSKGVEC
jgi:hypothetical protein